MSSPRLNLVLHLYSKAANSTRAKREYGKDSIEYQRAKRVTDRARAALRKFIKREET